ncbi:MAG: hypothetical protein ABWZ98_09445 [Nakamurella sp.]
MVTVRIEHPIQSFEGWKAAFDRDPVDRRGSGVRRYHIFRPVDDPAFVMIDLEFDSRTQASTFIGAMRRVWASPQAAPGLGGQPRAVITESVEDVAL